MKVYVITEEISLTYDDDIASTYIVAVYDSREKAISYMEQYVKDSKYTINYRGDLCIICHNEYERIFIDIEEFEVE